MGTPTARGGRGRRRSYRRLRGGDFYFITTHQGISDASDEKAEKNLSDDGGDEGSEVVLTTVGRSHEGTKDNYDLRITTSLLRRSDGSRSRRTPVRSPEAKGREPDGRRVIGVGRSLSSEGSECNGGVATAANIASRTPSSNSASQMRHYSKLEAPVVPRRGQPGLGERSEGPKRRTRAGGVNGSR
jgi:hypothetical protein